MNTATPKIKENRMEKLEKKNEELIIKIDTHIEDKKKKAIIKPYEIETFGSDISYKFYVPPNAIYI